MTTCRLCGSHEPGVPFAEWVKDTFTDFDRLLPGDTVCNDCLFWLDEKSTELMRRAGKDKLQKMRNYSHFVKGGQWTPYSKGDKAGMRRMLLEPPFPELAAIADSGQKHIVFKARRNEIGQSAGWIGFEEMPIWVEPDQLDERLTLLDEMLGIFSKGEIAGASYYPHRIMQYGLERWQVAEARVSHWRGSGLFALALFLAQGVKDERTSEESGADDRDSMDGNPGGLQEPLSHDHLGAVRAGDQKRRVHKQSPEVPGQTVLPFTE